MGTIGNGQNILRKEQRMTTNRFISEGLLGHSSLTAFNISSNSERSTTYSHFKTVSFLLFANPTVTLSPEMIRHLPAAGCQGSSPWSSSFPPTPSSCVWALADTWTWSPSWPARHHHPPSGRRHHRLPRLPRLPRPRSWSHLPRTAASVAPRTDASDA